MKTKCIEDIKERSAVSINSINLTKLEWALPYIKDNSVQLILTDLPYGQTEQAWDKILNYDFLWKHWRRILKDNGTVVMTATGLFTGISMMSAKDLYKYDLIWEKSKSSGFVHAHNKPLRNFENVLVFSKGTTVHKNQSKNRMVYNPQGLIKTEDGRQRTNNARQYLKIRGKKADQGYTTQEYTNYPKSILKFNSAHNPYHPTEKPLELWQYLIKTYSNENDLVLDVCGGSCVTAVAAISTSRKYIVFEMTEKYWKYGRKRLKFFKREGRDGNKKEILDSSPSKSTFK